MFENLEIFRTAMAMARHAGAQQAYSAQNIANADTPGYHARELPAFRDTVRESLTGQKATRPSHLNGSFANELTTEERSNALDPNGNTVSLEAEMVKAVDARRQHDRALAIYRSNLNILRASIGSK